MQIQEKTAPKEDSCKINKHKEWSERSSQPKDTYLDFKRCTKHNKETHKKREDGLLCDTSTPSQLPSTVNQEK